MRTLVPLLLLLKGLKPTEESGKAGKFNYPSVETDGKREPAARGEPRSQIHVKLTENGAMYPTATVSGIYIAHPDSQYFMIGSIDEEQMKDYAARRNLSEAEAKKLLNKNIS